MDRKVVYEFPKANDERICASLSSYRDKIYVDLRIFFVDSNSGELRPTKKGITLPESLFSQLKNAVLSCEKELFTVER